MGVKSQMAGLKLIEGYSSGSEDEEEHYEENAKKKIKLNNLPLPKYTPVGLKANDHEEVVDDPEQHGGRVRSFKHERGNWATLVYVDYEPTEDLFAWMTSVSSQAPPGTLIVDDCHLSFTRTLILKYHWIEPFVEGLKALAQATKQFTLQMTNVRVYCNEERTRTFLGIECHCSDLHLSSFMDSLNELLKEYQLPSFYEDASYHMSFMWFLGDKEEELKTLIPTLNESLNNALSRNVDNSTINVNEIHCKVGNKLYKLNLV